MNNNYEINLTDYIKIIFKRWKTIFFVFVLFFLAVFVFSLLSNKIYEITSSLQLGKVGENLIESPIQLVEKFNNSVYGSLVKKEFGLEKIPQIKAKNPKNTNLINFALESAQPQKSIDILSFVGESILKEHQEKADQQINFIQNDIEKLKNKVALVNDDIVVNKNKSDIVEDNIAKIENKIVHNQEDIKRLRNKIASKQEEKNILQDKVSALEEELVFKQTPGTQFALFSAQESLENLKQEIEDLYLQINFLEKSNEDYKISINSLNSSKEDYQIKINALSTNKDNLEIEVNKLNKEIAQIEPTRIIKPASVSSFPVKPRLKLNLAVAGVLGLFVGIFLAFAKEWWKKEMV